MAEPGGAGVLVDSRQILTLFAPAVAHAVIPREVGRSFSRGHDVIGRKRVFGVRQGDVDDLAAGSLEPFNTLLPGFLDLFRHAIDAVFLGNTDLEALHGLATGCHKVRHVIGQRGGILGIMTGHGLQQNGAVLDRLGERTRVIERGGKGDRAPARGPAIGRFDTNRTGEGCRLANGTARIRSRRAKTQIRCNSSRRTTRGTTRRQHLAIGTRPGIVDRTGICRLVGGAHGELVHRGLAQEDTAIAPQLGGHRTFIRRLEIFQDIRGGRRGDTFDREQVLDRQWGALDEAALTLGQLLVGHRGHGQRLVLVKRREGIERRLRCLCRCQGVLCQLRRRDLLGLQLGGHLVEGKFEKITHCSLFSEITSYGPE